MSESGNKFYLSEFDSPPTWKDVERFRQLIVPAEEFGAESTKALLQCHPFLIMLANIVVKAKDIRIKEGHRGKEAQDKAVKDGRSKIQWPNGPHNHIPSIAMDIEPYPLMVDAKGQVIIADFWLLAGHVMMAAAELKIKVRWGRNWKSDLIYWKPGTDISSQEFNDYYHWELVLDNAKSEV